VAHLFAGLLNILELLLLFFVPVQSSSHWSHRKTHDDNRTKSWGLLQRKENNPIHQKKYEFIDRKVNIKKYVSKTVCCGYIPGRNYKKTNKYINKNTYISAKNCCQKRGRCTVIKATVYKEADLI